MEQPSRKTSRWPRGGTSMSTSAPSATASRAKAEPGPVLIGGSRRIASYGDTDRLYDYVSRTMPFDDAGSLSEQQYWDSIAYLLDANDLLPAEAVLGPDSETITLER